MNRILIIEDDIFVQTMLRQTFERAGYEVNVASTGRIGVERYQSKSFDVVITDMIMPDMEGIETIATMRKSNPDVKIIAISGGGRDRPDDYLHLANKLGAARTFAKPLDRVKLLDAVKELIS